MRSYRPRTRRVVCRAVAGVAVVSDSNGYLPEQLARANAITVLQQYVHFGDGRRVPEAEVDLDAFFDEMRSAEHLPTTSHPTVDDFRAAYEGLVDYARQRRTSGADAWVVQHVRSPELADRLVDAAREVFNTEPVFCSEIGAVVGAHTGPGLLGIGALPPRLLT